MGSARSGLGAVAPTSATLPSTSFARQDTYIDIHMSHFAAVPRDVHRSITMRKNKVHECDMPTYMPGQKSLSQIALQPSSTATSIPDSDYFSQNSIVKPTQGARKGQIGIITEVECAGTSARVSWVWVLFDESSAIRLSVDSVEKVEKGVVLQVLRRGMSKIQSPQHGSTPRFVPNTTSTRSSPRFNDQALPSSPVTPSASNTINFMRGYGVPRVGRLGSQATGGSPIVNVKAKPGKPAAASSKKPVPVVGRIGKERSSSRHKVCSHGIRQTRCPTCLQGKGLGFRV